MIKYRLRYVVENLITHRKKIGPSPQTIIKAAGTLEIYVEVFKSASCFSLAFFAFLVHSDNIMSHHFNA